MLGFRGFFKMKEEVAQNAKSVNINFGDGLSTSIRLVTDDNLPEEDGAIYDLQGRKVVRPVKGLYIKNGKKIIMK